MTVGFIGISTTTEHTLSLILKGNIGVVFYDENARAARELTLKLANEVSATSTMCIVSYTLEEFIRQIPPHRSILVHASDAKHLDGMIEVLLAKGLSQGDILIDVGKSETPDTIRRYQELREKAIGYIDCGILLDSPQGRFSLMLGGDESAVGQMSWLWNAIAGAGGWKYAGRSGNGHYTAFH